MSRYRLAAAVESDLEAIWHYIAEHNEDAADQWLARFFDAFKKIAESPGIGHTRRDLTHQPIRF